MYAMDWRNYMPDIGRFTGMDALSEAYESQTPYHFALNNPANYSDPTGMYTRDANGNIITSDRGEIDSFMSYLGAGGSVAGVNNLVNNNAAFSLELPEVTINARGNSRTWNNSANLGYNSFQMYSKFTGAMGEATYDMNSSNMGSYILNSKASQSVAAFENFMFLELPATLLGGEVLALGWRVSGIGRILCRPMGRLTNGLIKICFTGGTLVATEKGSKKIEDIKEGDLVWSYNEKTGKKELKKVVELSRNTSSSLLRISLNGTEITCTPEHPFYVNGSWIEAKDLIQGILLTTLDERTTSVESIKFLDEKVKVYNFEVEDNHNYYVSDKGVLVHNNCEWLEATISQAKSWVSTEPGMQSIKAIDDIAGKLAKNDPFVFAQPIKVVEAEGKTFILNGHHRIQAAIKMGYEGSIPYQKIPAGQISQHSGFGSIGELLKVFGH